MSTGQPGNPKGRRLLIGVALAATLGGAAFGALPVYANSPASPAGASAYPPPPEPYAPEPIDDGTSYPVAPVKLDSASLKVTGTVGVVLSATLTLTSSYPVEATYTVLDAAKLPPGITIGADGRISGTPTAGGTFAVPVKVCVFTDCVTDTVTFTIGGGASISWNLTVTYTGVVGQPGSGTITVSGAPYGAKITYTVLDKSKLPPGLKITSDGRIVGTPTKPGTYVVPVKVCAGTTCMTVSITITVGAPATTVKISVEGFTGVVGKPATGKITVTGAPDGTAVTFTVVDPTKLPPGITIGADGQISGTPTVAGTYEVPIKICLGTTCANTTITLSVGSRTTMAIALTDFSGYLGEPVAGRFILEGAAETVFTVLDATKLPPGVSVAADGTLSGVATAKGVFTFPVKICVGTACGNTTLTITILGERPTYEPVSTTEAKVVIQAGRNTSVALPVDPGQVVAVVDASNLPPGITVGADGSVTGVATAPGTYAVLVKVGSETWKVTFEVGKECLACNEAYGS